MHILYAYLYALFYIVDMTPYTKEYILKLSSSDLEQSNIYELTGVVIHSGTSDSGHYYSLIKDTSPTSTTTPGTGADTTGGAGASEGGKWYQFDDAEVRVYDTDNMKNDCYGGGSRVHELQSVQDIHTTSYESTKNAYILVYSRRKPTHTIPYSMSNGSTMAVEDDNDAPATATTTVYASDVTSSGGEMGRTLDLIKKENESHALLTRVLSTYHMKFHLTLLSSYRSLYHPVVTSSQGKMVYDLPTIVLYESVVYYNRFVCHSASIDLMQQIHQALMKSLEYTLHRHAESTDHSTSSGSGTVTLPIKPSSSTYASGTSPPSSTIWKSFVNKTKGGISSMISDKHSSKTLHTTGAFDTEAQSGTGHNSDSTHNSLNGTEGVVSEEDACELIINYYINHFDTVIMSLLFAPELPIRDSFVKFLLKILTILFYTQGSSIIYNDTYKKDMKLNLLSQVLIDTSFKDSGINNSQHTNDDKIKGSNNYNTNTHNANNSGAIRYDNSNSDAMDEDEQLAMAIKMSQELSTPTKTTSASPYPSQPSHPSDTTPGTTIGSNKLPLAPTITSTTTSPVKPVVTVIDDTTKTTDKYTLSPELKSITKFLILLTMEKNITLIAEHWRRSESLLWLILELCKLDWSLNWLLVKREMISQLIDVFLGDQSPLSGHTYIQGTRKRAPSSYCVVGPLTKSGELPYVARNLPDFSYLIEAVVYIVTHAKSEAMVNRVSNQIPGFNNSFNLMSSFRPILPTHPPTLPPGSEANAPVLDTTCKDCCKCRPFLATILRQTRYATLAHNLIIHLSWETYDYTILVIELLFEAISTTSYEVYAHIFSVMDAFLGIVDSHTATRFKQLTFGQTDIIGVL